MKIGKPEITYNGDQARLSSNVSYAGRTDTLWFSVDKAFGDFLTSYSDGFLCALLMIAMYLGEDIVVHGLLSERLYYSVQNQLQVPINIVFPLLHKVKVFADNVGENKTNASGVATGFSAGIDSFSALNDHFLEKKPKGFTITHLLYNNVGSHHSGGERLWLERLKRIEPVVERIGLPLIKVNSNLSDFYKIHRKEYSFAQTSTLRNAAVPLILQEGIHRFLYSSSFDYNSVSVSPHGHLNFIEPIVLPLLTTEAVDMHLVGAEKSRIQKILEVAKVQDSYDSLDVCASGSECGNCSSCYKCVRTMLTLEIAGLLNPYSISFDIDKYEKKLPSYVATILDSNSPLERELVQFAKDNHFSFPRSAYVMLVKKKMILFTRHFIKDFKK